MPSPRMLLAMASLYGWALAAQAWPWPTGVVLAVLLTAAGIQWMNEVSAEPERAASDA